MPITENGTIEYEVPEGIKEKIPLMFYQALFGELISVHGFDCLIPNGNNYTDMVSEFISYIVGTAAWHTAFIETCHKLSMEWLADYEDSLEWYDSDIFFGEISEEIINKFCNAKHSNTTDYYRFLVKKHDEIKKIKEHREMGKVSLTFDFNKEKVERDGFTTDELLAPMRAHAEKYGIDEPEYGVFEMLGEHAMCSIGMFIVNITKKNPAYISYLNTWIFNVCGDIEDCIETTKERYEEKGIEIPDTMTSVT